MSDQSGPKLTEWAVAPTYEQIDRVTELQECAHKERACHFARSVLQRAKLWGDELYEGKTFVYRAAKILEQKISGTAISETLNCSEACALVENIKDQTIEEF